MELFADNRFTFATRANAIKKLERHLGDNMGNYFWVIGVNAKGRFYPIVTGSYSMEPTTWLTNVGICVTSFR